MKNWKKIIIISQIFKNSKIKKAFIYIILWGAGSIVGGSILLLWSTAGNTENTTIFNNFEKLPEGKKTYNNFVDELLLSANELKIYGKGSIIDNKYKDNLITDELLIQQIRANPDKAYKAILKNKLENLKSRKTAVADFSIKPVPK